MLGVTGPNEYENNVDNNWYTNLMAQWTLRYTVEAIDHARALDAAGLATVIERVGLDESAEPSRWSDVADRIRLPGGRRTRRLPPAGRTISTRSCSPSPISIRPSGRSTSTGRGTASCGRASSSRPTCSRGCGCSRIDTTSTRSGATSISTSPARCTNRRCHRRCTPCWPYGSAGLHKAHEMLLRTARLDLDDVNNDTDDGCHTTSMAGTWIATVQGFGGMTVVDGELHLEPDPGAGLDVARLPGAVSRCLALGDGGAGTRDDREPIRGSGVGSRRLATAQHPGAWRADGRVVAGLTVTCAVRASDRLPTNPRIQSHHRSYRNVCMPTTPPSDCRDHVRAEFDVRRY